MDPVLAPGARHPTSSLDQSAVDSLRESVGHDAGFLAELIGTFLAESPGQLAALRAAIERSDAEEARLVAHTLKSNAATFGAAELEEVCREAEGRAREGDVPGMSRLLPAIDTALADARAPLQSLASGAAA